MILVSFKIEDKLKKAQFFQKIFLLANTSVKMILKIFLLTFSYVNMSFLEQKLIWKFYIVAKALLTIKQVKCINKKEFAKVTLNENNETFIVHMTFSSLRKKPTMTIHPAKKTQIVLLLAQYVKILAKYLDFPDVFVEKKALVLLERI